MKLQDFTEEMLNTIAENAKLRLMKLGINANVKAEVKRGRYDENIEIKTDAFNTTPVLYKSIIVSGSAPLIEDEYYEGAYDLVFVLNYWFEHFDGGRNGATLGSLKFRVLEKSYDKVRCLGLEI